MNKKNNITKKHPVFPFEYVLRRRGMFFISALSLERITHGYQVYGVKYPPQLAAFERLLEVENLEVVKKSDDLSLIRKNTSIRQNKTFPDTLKQK